MRAPSGSTKCAKSMFCRADSLVVQTIIARVSPLMSRGSPLQCRNELFLQIRSVPALEGLRHVAHARPECAEEYAPGGLKVSHGTTVQLMYAHQNARSQAKAVESRVCHSALVCGNWISASTSTVADASPTRAPESPATQDSALAFESDWSFLWSSCCSTATSAHRDLLRITSHWTTGCKSTCRFHLPTSGRGHCGRFARPVVRRSAQAPCVPFSIPGLRLGRASLLRVTSTTPRLLEKAVRCP